MSLLSPSLPPVARLPALASVDLTAKRTQIYACAVFALFFLQDPINLVLARLGAGGFVAPFSALKEAMVVGFCAAYAATRPERIRITTTTMAFATLFALLMVGYAALGVLSYPPDAVVFEARTLLMPLALIVFGWMYADALRGDVARADVLVRVYLIFAAAVAVSAIVDYLFLGDDFWSEVGITELYRLKGFEMLAAGALPENMYSFYFGRRAFGLALDPLNLGYLMVPAVIFAWCRRNYLLCAVTAAALVLSWSRMPIVATAVVLLIAMFSQGMRVALMLVVTIVFVWYVGDTYRELQNDPSALGHFETVGVGLTAIADQFFGYGVGAAGIYASAYSDLTGESVLLNIWNQIGPVGMLLYAALILPGLTVNGPYSREVRLVAIAYGLTTALSPHALVIKSTFAFFVFVGINLGLSGARSPR